MLAIALPTQLCHACGMANDKPTGQPESKFAEVIRKGREKRNGMQQQSERRAEAEAKALAREDSPDTSQAVKIDGSEPESDLP